MYWSSENLDEFRRMFNGPAATCAKDVQVRKISQIYGNVQWTGSDLYQRCLQSGGYTLQVTFCSVGKKALFVNKCSAVYW